MASEEQVGQELQPQEKEMASERIDEQSASRDDVGTEDLPQPSEAREVKEANGEAAKEQPPKDAAEEERPSEIEDLKPGMRLKGKVRNIVDFGAFIDVGVGRDGLAHISTLQRAGIDKTLSVGDVIDVQVRRVDTDRNRISLTVPGAGRGTKTPLEKLEAGSETTGRVVRLVDFGAFVDIGAQTDGLLHISQLSAGYINHPREVVEVGQEVQVRILDVDTDRRRISLSMKDVEEAEQSFEPEPQEDAGPSVFAAAWQEALKEQEQRQRHDSP